jgi:predicted nucleic acid-binding protein
MARWWDRGRLSFEIWTSELVLQEARRGDPAAASRRLAALEGIPLLMVTPEAAELASEVVRAHLLPDRAFPDALHIALASVHSVDYLLTWSCAHIANAELLPRAAAIVRSAGFRMPFVGTPEEPMGDADVS